MTNPKLVRIKRNKNGIIQDCDVYIGRAINRGGWDLAQSKWANPFTMQKYGSAANVCELYFKHIINSNTFHDLPELENKTLGCWCDYNPESQGFYCHGCVLLQLFKLVKHHNYDTQMVQQVLKNAFN